jgi:uncharacterized protein (DUF427 family)
MTSNRFENLDERVRVEIDRVIVADSNDVIALHEGTLPVRYYFPKSDVRFEYFVPSDTVTRCHWKGEARYWSAHVGDSVHDDVLWGYDTPLPGAEEIAGRVSFYNHRVLLVADQAA